MHNYGSGVPGNDLHVFVRDAKGRYREVLTRTFVHGNFLDAEQEGDVVHVYLMPNNLLPEDWHPPSAVPESAFHKQLLLDFTISGCSR